MLKKNQRILKKKEFDNVFKNGKSAYFKILGLKACKSEKKESRFGIIVSTKISKKATNRNRLKRQVRAIISQKSPRIKEGYDIIIIVLPQIKEADFASINEAIEKCLNRLWLIRK